MGWSTTLKIQDFIGNWRDTFGHDVWVGWSRPGNRGGQLDVQLRKPGSIRDPIKLAVKDLGNGRFACGHYDLDIGESHRGKIVWLDHRNPGRRSIWNREDGWQQSSGSQNEWKEDRRGDWKDDRHGGWKDDRHNEWKDDRRGDWANDRRGTWNDDRRDDWKDDRRAEWKDDRHEDGWQQSSWSQNEWKEDRRGDWKDDRHGGWKDHRHNEWKDDRRGDWANERRGNWNDDRRDDWKDDRRAQWKDDRHEQQLLCAAIHFLHRHIRSDPDVLQRMEGNQMFKLFFEVQYHSNKPELNKIFPESVHDCSALHVCFFILNILHQGIFSVSAFIVSVIYLSRFKESSHITLHACTWRPLFITSLLLADKMLEDNPVRNSSLAKLFPVLDTAELNKMEREFLGDIRFDVHVKPDFFCSFCEKLLAEQVHQEITRCVNDSEYAATLQADHVD